MFAGEFQSRVEVGGLFRLPPKFLAAFPPPQEGVSRQLVVLKSLDRSLWLYQAQRWEAKVNAVRQQVSAEQSRVLMHYIMAESALVDLDPQGRLAIPEALLTYAKITTDVVLVGLYDRIEVWNPVCWLAYLAGLEERQETGLGRILDLL
jgi:MraZ protein